MSSPSERWKTERRKKEGDAVFGGGARTYTLRKSDLGKKRKQNKTKNATKRRTSGSHNEGAG